MVMLVSPQGKEVGAISERDWLILILIAASLVDLIRYRVPNKLIVPALSISLICRLQFQGVTGILPWMVGMVIPIVVCFVFYMCRMIGASDVKIYSVIGSFVDYNQRLAIMIGSLFFGAVMAIGKMIIRRNFSSRFRHFFNYVMQMKEGKAIPPYYDLKKQGDDGVIPFTVAITMSALYVLYH